MVFWTLPLKGFYALLYEIKGGGAILDEKSVLNSRLEAGIF